MSEVKNIKHESRFHKYLGVKDRGEAHCTCHWDSSNSYKCNVVRAWEKEQVVLCLVFFYFEGAESSFLAKWITGQCFSLCSYDFYSRSFVCLLLKDITRLKSRKQVMAKIDNPTLFHQANKCDPWHFLDTWESQDAKNDV